MFCLSLEHELKLRILSRSSFRVAERLEVSSEAEKTAQKKRRSLSPTNPFLKFFRKKESNFPSIDEPPAEIVRPRQVKAKLKMKFEREDLEITNAAVPEDADRNSPEYRSKIRALRLVEREISAAYVC